ncbi:MAG: fibronectin type III domain-containing protein [Candidatus Sericytochromatia bacterium]|nr:fibronectin type III domain-containing protein [Candidatus Sericytochromatia bacterium]
MQTMRTMKAATQPLCRLALVATLLGACAPLTPTAPTAGFGTRSEDAGVDADANRNGQPKPPATPSRPVQPPKPRPTPRATKPAPKPRPSAGMPTRPNPTPYPGGNYPGGNYPGGNYPGRHLPYPGGGYYPAPDYDRYPDHLQAQTKITRVWTEAVGTGGFTINWTTTAPTTGIVEWGTDRFESRSGWLTPADTYHTYTVTGLAPGTEYRYRVTARTTDGTAVRSPEMRETTGAKPWAPTPEPTPEG